MSDPTREALLRTAIDATPLSDVTATIIPMVDPVYWDSAVDTSGMQRVGPEDLAHVGCQWKSSDGWPCLASELEHDGAWAFGHHYWEPE